MPNWLTRKVLPAGQGPVKSRAFRAAGRTTACRLVLDLDGAREMRSFTVGPDGSAGHRLVVELPPSAAVAAPRRTGAATPRALPPSGAGARRSSRATRRRAPVVKRLARRQTRMAATS